MIGWEKTDDPEMFCQGCGLMEDHPGQFQLCFDCGQVFCAQCRPQHQHPAKGEAPQDSAQ